MKTLCAMGAVVVLVWAAAQATPQAAQTIYTWTDANGVRHYTTSAPPADAVDPEIYIQGGNETGPADQGNARRESFDNMVERARIEAERLEQERLEAERTRERQEREAAEKRRQAELAAKRRALQEKIDALRGRALSPTFSQGMRDSQIEALQAQIDQLETRAESRPDSP